MLFSYFAFGTEKKNLSILHTLQDRGFLGQCHYVLKDSNGKWLARPMNRTETQIRFVVSAAIIGLLLLGRCQFLYRPYIEINFNIRYTDYFLKGYR